MSNLLRSAASAAAAFSITVGAIALLAQPASAAGPEFSVIGRSSDLPVEYVRTNDLDLTSAAGRDRLDRRLRGASRRVCDLGSALDITYFEMRCRKAAMKSANIQAAALIERANRLAAAGSPAPIDAVVAIVAPEAE